MKSRVKTFVIWDSLITILVLIISRGSKPDRVTSVPPAEFDQLLQQDLVDAYTISSRGLEFTRYAVGGRFVTRIDTTDLEAYQDLMVRLQDAGVAYISPGELAAESQGSNVLVYLLLGIGGALLFFLILRRMGGGANQNIFALRNSKARLATEESKVRFADVGGCVEAKQELSDIVAFLREPQRWLDAGARLPRGILLEGPPGCGKTLLARAIAGETDAKFYYTSASEFVEMFIGVGPARVRDMFETAKKELPAVLFIDELDAIGRRRGSDTGFANEEREQTLNQILVCMDGFEPTDRIVVIGATNRSDILDKALVRSGRFDRRIRIEMLDADARLAVLNIHTRGKSLAAGVSLSDVVTITDGLSGADIEALCNLAALLALRRTRGTQACPPHLTMIPVAVYRATRMRREPDSESPCRQSGDSVAGRL